ncbi:MAG TPA: peptide ABC transporter substrate-binding protein [Rhizomicrobium sp.]|nr:peptide ABC transporter substrate-binding protein [Rhizomicrobium sp.]
MKSTRRSALRGIAGSTLVIGAPWIVQGCSRGKNSPRQSKLLRAGNDGEPDTFDPQLYNSLAAWRIAHDLFIGLMTRDARGRPILGLASSHEISADGRVHRFALRDTKWSDGTALVAEQLVMSWQRAADPATASPSAHLLRPLRRDGHGPLSAVAVNSRTIEFTLSLPAPFLPFLLAHPVMMPLPMHIVSRLGAKWSSVANHVSNGAYRLADWHPNDVTRLVKNAHFADASTVAIEEVQYFPAVDDAAATMRFRSGDLDYTIGFPPAQRQFLIGRYPKAVKLESSLAAVFIACSLRQPDLARVSVRRALALAVDREFLASTALGAGQTAAYRLVPPIVPAISHAPVALDFAGKSYGERLREAAGLLKAAGYGPLKPLRLRFHGLSGSEGHNVAAALQAMWARIGTEITLELSDLNSHYRRIGTGEFELALVNWLPDVPDPSSFLVSLRPRSAEYVNTGYRSDAVEALMDQADISWDAEKRADVLAAAERAALTDLPHIPIYFDANRALVAPALKGFEPSPLAVHPARWIRFDAGV